jgi:hypothetical protein
MTAEPAGPEPWKTAQKYKSFLPAKQRAVEIAFSNEEIDRFRAQKLRNYRITKPFIDFVNMRACEV